MSKLLVKPAAPDAQGRIHHITPESAGWGYVGFDVYDFIPGGQHEADTGARETCLVLVSGKAEIWIDGKAFGSIGERMSPFDGPGWSVYLPAGSQWRIVAQTACELAVCSSPGSGGKFPARIIAPTDNPPLTRGTGTNLRHIRNILPDDAPAQTLLVVEVITPGGHWSSYPPHKHDTDDFPRETYLEETYYHRLKRGSGFAVQRVYTDDRSLDETMAVENRDVVLVPRGYHPVSASHGFDLYYLNVMAGPKRAWKFTMSKDHEFLGW